jgi:hypothetical protein
MNIAVGVFLITVSYPRTSWPVVQPAFKALGKQLSKMLQLEIRVMDAMLRKTKSLNSYSRKRLVMRVLWASGC